MNTYIKLIFISFIISIISCKKTKPQDAKLDITGNYVSQSYEKRAEGYDWLSVNISQPEVDKIKVSVRSRTDKKNPTCTFDTYASKINETTYQTTLDNKVIKYEFTKDHISISTIKFENRFVLMYYCSGGGSIGGQYNKIKGALDDTQIDKRPFSNMIVDGKNVKK